MGEFYLNPTEFPQHPREGVLLLNRKNQIRVIGFFGACVRRRYLIENPAIGLGKIKVVQLPTDLLPSG